MKKKIFIVTTALGALAPVAVFAEESGSGTANTAVVDAMTGLASDMTATASSIVPIALGVIGIAIVVTFGIKIFKKIIGR